METMEQTAKTQRRMLLLQVGAQRILQEEVLPVEVLQVDPPRVDLLRELVD